MTYADLRPAQWAALADGGPTVLIESDKLPRGAHLPRGAGRLMLEAITHEFPVADWTEGDRTLILVDSPWSEASCRSSHGAFGLVAIVTLAHLIGADSRERGGRAESSLMLAIRPDAVDLSDARPVLWDPIPSVPGLLIHPSHLPEGGWGDPAGASAEEGEAILGRARERLRQIRDDLGRTVLAAPGS